MFPVNFLVPLYAVFLCFLGMLFGFLGMPVSFALLPVQALLVCKQSVFEVCVHQKKHSSVQTMLYRALFSLFYSAQATPFQLALSMSAHPVCGTLTTEGDSKYPDMVACQQSQKHDTSACVQVEEEIASGPHELESSFARTGPRSARGVRPCTPIPRRGSASNMLDQSIIQVCLHSVHAQSR